MDMATSTSRAASRTRGRVLVYDGDCPMCTRATAWLVRLGVLAEGDRRTVDELSDDTAERVLAAGLRDELVALDTASGDLRPGFDGLLWVLAATSFAPVAWAARGARRTALRTPLSALYRFVALNRRFLSAPRPRTIPCACDPTPRPGHQRALLAFCMLFAVLVTLALGAVAPAELRLVGSRLGHLGPVVKAGWPWVLPVLLGLTLDAPLRLSYLTHLAVTAAAGALVFLPLAVAGALAPETVGLAFETLLQLACGGAALLMFVMQRRRIAYLRLPGLWLLGWAACAGFGLLTLGWLRTLG